jgi:hypothetical protein
MSPRTSSQLCARMSDIFGHWQTLRGRWKGANVSSPGTGSAVNATRGGGPPIKAGPYLLRLRSRHQTAGDWLRSPKAGVLDHWISLWSLYREPILQNADARTLCVGNAPPGNVLDANHGPGSLSANVPGFLIRLGLLLP